MKNERESRRRFLKNVAGLSAVAIANPVGVVAGELPPQSAVQTPQNTATTPTQAQYLGEIVRQRYGQYLTPDQLADVLRGLDGAMQRSKRLREFKLKNSDEPDSTFHALD
jgi:hypothetical protein